ncbi:hypothetical protein, partial [Belliella buryatensis]|uniref:hypothetical protein n=1 Tax=Belliella buryatensis TaxID=1500549 RepID=UPI001481FA6F
WLNCGSCCDSTPPMAIMAISIVIIVILKIPFIILGFKCSTRMSFLNGNYKNLKIADLKT